MVNVIQQIVVPGSPAVDNGLAVKPFKQIHLHDTANLTATMQNERDYLARNYPAAYFTHMVGFNHETGKAEAWQVARKNAGGYDLGGVWNWEGYASIEIAYGSVKTAAQHKAVWKVYIELARQLAKEAGIKDFTLDTINTEGIKTHYFASLSNYGSDHVDPVKSYMAKWGVSYDQLKKDIKNGLEAKTVVVDTKNYPAAQSKVTGTLLTVKNAGGVGVYTDKSLQAKFKRPVFLAKGTQVYASEIVQHGSTTRYKTALGYITAKKLLVSSSKVVE